MKIMVVDDEQDVQLLFKQKFRKELRKGEIDIFFASSAQEAIDYLEQEETRVMLILSDINMPGMSGLDLLKAVKEKFPDLKVFMITAYGADDNYKTAIQYGADDYLNKPVDFNKLKEKILSILANSSEGVNDAGQNFGGR